MTRDVARQVRQRAQDRCEYCHLPASVFPLPFHIDHIKARQHGGLTVLENLALACLHCNRHKGPNLAGADPNTGEIIRLFHPRTDRWTEHFEWAGRVGGSGPHWTNSDRPRDDSCARHQRSRRSCGPRSTHPRTGIPARIDLPCRLGNPSLLPSPDLLLARDGDG